MNILIPIAQSNKTGEIVFIEEVDAGLACDCVCIDCHVTLIARKGTVKAHHFSHAAGEVDPDHCCMFSFERSVLLMIRLLLSQAKTMTLPAYTLSLHHHLMPNYPQHQITQKSVLTIDEVEFPLPIDKLHKTDTAIITRAGYPLAVTFCLDANSSSAEANKNNRIARPFHYQDKNIAHLWVDLTQLQELFRNKKCQYRLLLTKIIIESSLQKKWLYHPNERPYRNQFKQQLEKIYSEQKSNKPFKQQKVQLKQKTAVSEPASESESKSKPASVPVKKVSDNKSVDTPQIISQPQIASHVSQARALENMKQNSRMRLAQLLEQVENFRNKDNPSGYRCKACYFMNSVAHKCQFCDNQTLELVILDDDYFDNIEHKYDCACYPINSLKRLASVEINLADG